jgi:hypothetical protein
MLKVNKHKAADPVDIIEKVLALAVSGFIVAVHVSIIAGIVSIAAPENDISPVSSSSAPAPQVTLPYIDPGMNIKPGIKVRP